MMDKMPASTVKKYFVKESELPISCPTKDMTLWNAHPRVFLALSEEGEHEMTCPYCGTVYVLESHGNK
jgi:uncharacterized Zn-finger protein